jgi:arsenical pump membrane protein
MSHLITIIVAVAIFVVVLGLVIWQPKGLSIGWPAIGGAILALLTGVVHLSDIPTVVGIVWDATLTFVAIIIISLILDSIGFFSWAALHVARLAGGKNRRALVLIMLLGATIAAFFANDGAALILTPIVYEMMVALQFERKRALAFVIACGFIADTASLPLVVSNLVNIVSADFFHINFVSYVRMMLLPDLVSIVASILVVLFVFRRESRGTFDPTALQVPKTAIRDLRLFRIGWGVLILVVGGYFAGALLHIPVSVVAGTGAVVLLIAAQGSKVVQCRKVILSAPWKIVVFSLGMYLVVFGLRNAGLTMLLTNVIAGMSQHGLVTGTVGTGALIAVLSSVMNNMPTVLIGALSISPIHLSSSATQGLIYANVIGADLGPKLTPLGSLATLLWLHVLEQRGVKISWGQYFRIGILITPPVLLVTLLTLVLCVHVFG